jgi:hypothetical protein
VPSLDLSLLPDDLRIAAILTDGGREVMWPRGLAQQVVNALADRGAVVLGLDLRSDGEGFTPPGLDTEVPWSAFHPRSAPADAEAARSEALAAISRLWEADLDAYQWVLVTW